MESKTRIIVMFILLIESNQEKNCTSLSTCQYEKGPRRYDKISNNIMKNIEEAVKSYIPCININCSCFTKVIDKDIQPFKSAGVTKDMINNVSDRGTKYQIIGHKLYRQKDCMFPARCSGIEHFIKPILETLPDMELIINYRDWPQIPKNLGKKFGPVFSFSKTKDYLDIMYPTWGFWEGGPAISLYPTGLGRWDNHRTSISEASKTWPWKDKSSKGFFRGSRTSDERDSIVLLSRKLPNFVDAQYTKNQAWKSLKDTLNANPAKEVSFENHCQYKYLFNFRGVAASFRFKHLFLCKSLVFHVGNDWKEFFYDALKPWIHYIPIKSYPSQEELKSLLEFFQEHDSLAQTIAIDGYHFIWDNLLMEDIQCYWKKLLQEYGNLIKFEVKLDETFIEIV